MRRGLPLLLAVTIGCTSAPRRGETPVPRPSLRTPVPTPSVAPTPEPTPIPEPPSPTDMPRNDLEDPLIRVLLRRSTSGVRLPQPGRPYRVSCHDETVWMWGPLEVAPAGSGAVWWQVGAFRDPSTAESAATRLVASSGGGLEVREMASDDGLVRVQVRWKEPSGRDQRGELEKLGFPDTFPVSGGGRLVARSVYGSRECGGEMVIEPTGDWPVALGEKRYRGRFRIGSVGADVLVVNELNLESYLRGVVPAEMGPFQFPELEALKAQAVAARTYAVAHLGDHAEEGWDICATPSCQVYDGKEVEHQLTDRAVRETAGLIAVFDGRPIDAMYTSTCGGHTEDAAQLFPDRGQPYLAGVPCAWERPLELHGVGGDSGWVDSTRWAAEVARAALDLGPEAGPEDLLDRMRGGPSPIGPTAVTVERFASALLAATDCVVGPLVPPGSPLDNLLSVTDLYRADLEPPVAGLTADWAAAASLAMLEVQGEVSHVVGEAVPHANGVGIFPRGSDRSEAIEMPFQLWERWSNGYRQVASATVLPGTALEKIEFKGQTIAVVIRRSGGDGEADRRSAWREWVRDREWSDLETQLGVPGMSRLLITRRAPSGRVVGLAAENSQGDRTEWQGFEVQRALKLPDSLFTMHLVTGPEQRRSVRFLGRGWGHGVGLCQNGSYGLARSGRSFVEILEHYYRGVTVARWAAVGVPPDPAGR